MGYMDSGLIGHDEKRGFKWLKRREKRAMKDTSIGAKIGAKGQQRFARHIINPGDGTNSKNDGYN